MATTERRVDRGKRRAERLLREIGDELQQARRAAGLSQRALAAACGVSHAQISRLERARLPNASFWLVAVVASVLGLDLTARLYAAGSPLRDAGHLALIARLRARLPDRRLRWRFEVPIALGDQRAWDAVIGCQDGQAMIEAETVIRDAQALGRRSALKMADSGRPCVILLIADTRTNRAALRIAGPMLRATFPLSQADVLAALAVGRQPAGSGIVVL